MQTCPDPCEFKTRDGWCGITGCIKQKPSTKLQFVYMSDVVNVVRCRDCKHCFSLVQDPMLPYEGEPHWYCECYDADYYVLEKDPNRFYCADGERRDES